MYQNCEHLCVIGSAPQCVHACIRARVHACMHTYMRACACMYVLAHICSLLCAACETYARRMKRTILHDTQRHGIEVLLLLVQSQRSRRRDLLLGGTEHISIPGGSFLQLSWAPKKTQQAAFFAVFWFAYLLAVCGHHMRIAQLMRIAWFNLPPCLPFYCSSASRTPRTDAAPDDAFAVNCAPPAADTYVSFLRSFVFLQNKFCDVLETVSPSIWRRDQIVTVDKIMNFFNHWLGIVLQCRMSPRGPGRSIECELGWTFLAHN